jgi:hypothetical protein
MGSENRFCPVLLKLGGGNIINNNNLKLQWDGNIRN